MYPMASPSPEFGSNLRCSIWSRPCPRVKASCLYTVLSQIPEQAGRGQVGLNEDNAATCRLPVHAEKTVDARGLLRNYADFMEPHSPALGTDTVVPPPRPTADRHLPAQDPYTLFRSTKVFPSLDGLRALSIIAVIGFHVMHGHSALFRQGHLGVQLFFAISGVLITTLLLRERDSAGEINLHNFYVRRTLRIFPLYYAVLGVYILATLLLEKGTQRGETFFANLPAYATYTSNWYVALTAGTGTIFYFAWSLATEEQFYLVWPWIVRFTRHWLVPVSAIFLAMVAGEVVRHAIGEGWVTGEAIVVRIVRSIASPICLGCIAAFAMHQRRGFSILHRFAGRSWSAPAALVVMVVAIQMRLHSLAIAVSMAFMVVATMIRPRHPLRLLLDNKMVRYIGAISYGMYLMHMLSYQVARKILGQSGNEWVCLLTTLVLVISVASISYYLFERRVQALKKRFERFPVPRPA